MDVLGTANLSEAAVSIVLHNGLAIRKFKNSSLPISDRDDLRPKGAVYMTRSKADLKRAVGFVATSQEAVFENMSSSHWTPNVFRFGKYADRRRHIISGHEEDHLKQINAFVVDADFGKEKPGYTAELLQKLIIRTAVSTEIWPTMVLETPHGYQAYYVLTQPAFVRRDKQGKLPVVVAAKKISEAIRAEVSKQLPQVDSGANHFGFFRMPSESNLCFFEPALLQDFSFLMDWARTFQESEGRIRERFIQKQVDQPWFIALTKAKVPRGDGVLGRNNTLLTLCLAMYSSGKTQEQAYDYADEWNSGQNAPLSDQEVRRIVRSAFSGRYQGANGRYIAELVESYAPGTPVKAISPTTWYKHAKARKDRQYSHLTEWAIDLVKYVSTRADLSTESLRVTTRELRDQLGISSQSLSRVLDHVAAVGMLRVKREIGRNGGIYLSTTQMLGRTIKRLKTYRSLSWREFLVQILETKAEGFTLAHGVNQLLESAARSGP